MMGPVESCGGDLSGLLRAAVGGGGCGEGALDGVVAAPYSLPGPLGSGVGGPGSSAANDYLELVAGRSRTNTLLATVYDLSVRVR